jgi:hypothetical protein
MNKPVLGGGTLSVIMAAQTFIRAIQSGGTR